MLQTSFQADKQRIQPDARFIWIICNILSVWLHFGFSQVSSAICAISSPIYQLLLAVHKCLWDPVLQYHLIFISFREQKYRHMDPCTARYHTINLAPERPVKPSFLERVQSLLVNIWVWRHNEVQYPTPVSIISWVLVTILSYFFLITYLCSEPAKFVFLKCNTGFTV